MKKPIVLDKPTTIMQHILHDLIQKNEITERDYCYNSFRQRLSELRSLLLKYGVFLKHKQKEFKNTFKHDGYYFTYYIYKMDRLKAIDLFLELQGKTPYKQIDKKAKK